MPWVPKKEEEVVLSEKAIEHGYYNNFCGEYFYTYKIRYRDVVRLEYDKDQCLLRIYGPREERWWTGIDRSQCHDKFPADYQNKETWIEIPTYFGEFEGLMKELEERTGKVIEDKTRPFITYK